jgi:nitrite reductase/ring-hydroxylating ferredoxin subunit
VDRERRLPLGFQKIGRVEEVPTTGGLRVEVGGREIAIFWDGQEVRAIDDLCPHRGAPLSEGFLERGKVFCPWHCFDFCLTTGISTTVSHLRVATYPVEIRDGVIFLDPILPARESADPLEERWDV